MQIVPSDEVMRVASEAGIGLPWGMKIIRTDELRKYRAELGLGVWASRMHVFHPWSMRYLDSTGHALVDITLSRYLERKEPLWWFVMLHTESSLKQSGFARSKMRQKVGSAFMQALQRKGYDKGGRGLPDSSDSAGSLSAAHSSRPTAGELYGSVKIEGGVKNLLDLQYEKLVEFCEVVVSGLEQTLRKS